MSSVLFSVYRDLHSNINGIGRWALGSLILAVTAVLFGLREVIPDWLSVIVANAGLLCGVGLWLVGTQLFYGRKPSWASVSAATILTMACVSWWLLVEPAYTLRLTSITGCLLGLYGVQLLLVVRYGVRHSSTYFLAFVLLLQIVVLLIRGVTSLLPTLVQSNFLSPDLIQAIYFATYSFVTLLLALGFVMVATHRLNMELKWYATRDPLTGVFNRRAFAEIYQREYQVAQRTGGTLALLIEDLDHFKAINDKYGHDVGDKVLVDFCRRANAVLVNGTSMARLGGEEFAVLLRGVSLEDASAQAERIRLSLLQDGDNELPGYTCSVGVATTAKDGSALEQLLRVADDALYHAKREGRNRVESMKTSFEIRSAPE